MLLAVANSSKANKEAGAILRTGFRIAQRDQA
jgi:hypothetical protein